MAAWPKRADQIEPNERKEGAEMQKHTGFSKRFRDWGEEKGLKQCFIAEKLGISAPTITRWRNGANPKHEHLKLLIELSGKDANFWLAPEGARAVKEE